MREMVKNATHGRNFCKKTLYFDEKSQIWSVIILEEKTFQKRCKTRIGFLKGT